MLEIAQDYGPGIKENCLNIEQNKQHPDQVELHGKAPARVSHRVHTALVSLHLRPSRLTLPDQPGERDNGSRNSPRQQDMDQKRQVACEVIVWHRRAYI